MPNGSFKTLDDIIGEQNRYDMNNVTFYRLDETGGLIVPDMTLFDIYYRLIVGYVTIYNTTEDNRARYRGRPYLMSQDIYGTPQLGWLIMKLNDRECPSRFTLGRTVRIINPLTLPRVFDMLSNKSAGSLEDNQVRFNSLVGEELGES